MSSNSGRIESGTGNFSKFYFQWQLAGQDPNANTSTINWQWGLNISNSAFWGSNAVKSVSGYIDGNLVFGANSYSGLSGNGDKQLITGSYTMGHDANGNKSFSMSSTGWLFGNGNFSNSGGWDLPSIARNATISATSGAINDESNPVINYNNPASHAVNAWLELEDLTGGTQYALRSNYVSGADFGLTSTERNQIRIAMANTETTTLRYVTQDLSTGFISTSDSTISILNGAPVFTTIAYHDSNAAAIAITGSNQSIIQNVSVLNLDIASANKATAVKGASMVSYTATINGVPTNITYTTGTINVSLGTVDAATNQTLAVTATDSRGNTTTVTKTVTMIAYAEPVITATGTREDGFGADTTIDINATYSPINVGGVDKNTVNHATGIGYKVWAVGGTEPGSYTNVASTYSAGNVTITSDPIETLDQSTEFNIKVKETDAVSTTTYSFIVGIGQSAFLIGNDGKVYNQNKQLIPATDAWPVGSVILKSVNTSPSGYLPGTWVATTTASATILGMTLYGFYRTV